MTPPLRQIEPFDLKGLSPRAPSTGEPIFERVDPRTLFVDPAYQRGLGERSVRQIRRIIEQFDWARFKPPVCAFSTAEDGSSILKVIDGQHTAIAAASHPDVDMIPVMIVEAPDVATQAAAFIGQNRDRLGITATQMHVAGVVAGDADALALARVCEAAGVRVLKNPAFRGLYKPGDTLAVTAIAALIKKAGEDEAVQVLAALVKAGRAPLTASQIKAVDHLVDDPQFATLDFDALPGSIREQGAQAERDAKAFSATHNMPLWRALASVWFKGAKKRRTPKTEAPPTSIRQARPAEPSPDLPSDLRRDERPARGGWSPGVHVRRCEACDGRFTGGRQATECAACVYSCEAA